MFTLWRAIAAALLALLFTRIDTFVDERPGDSLTGKAWRAYRSRGKTSVKRGAPPNAGGAIDTSGRPRP